jgi:catechol 2,3-dioxygenase-like lactoylglutathione lyase family enzyme
MLDHMTFRVRDIARAKAFYTPTLAPLGYTVAFEGQYGANILGFAHPDAAEPDGRRTDVWFIDGPSPYGGPCRHVRLPPGLAGRKRGRRWTRSTVRRMAAGGQVTTARRACVPTTTRTTTAPSSSTRKATTSKPSATSPADGVHATAAWPMPAPDARRP